MVSQSDYLLRMALKAYSVMVFESNILCCVYAYYYF